MKSIRILIVEDDLTVMATLIEMYKAIFIAHGYKPTIEQACNVEEARRLAKAAKDNPYDFVSLDVILGDANLTGLDVLATLKRFHSAWMVALLTGVETDTTVDERMGEERGESMRKQLRRDAYASFPAERLLVVEKPSSRIPADEANTLLANRLEQIALVYYEVSRLRYVFRPIEVASLIRVPVPKGEKKKSKFNRTTALHWQIRFNCGEIRTLPDKAGFKTLHYLLSIDRDQSVTPEEALAKEPKKISEKGLPLSSATDPLAEYFDGIGIPWKTLSSKEQENVIRATLSSSFKRYVELRRFQDEEDISPDEEDELTHIVQKIGPLAASAESIYERMSPSYDAQEGRDGTDYTQTPEEIDESDPHLEGDIDMTPAKMAQEGLHLEGGNYTRETGRRGFDSMDAEAFRARMKRVRDCLRENGFEDFAIHIAGYVQSTGANWSYSPPLDVEWTTT
jgi:CheY-like chemotaxis protein